MMEKRINKAYFLSQYNAVLIALTFLTRIPVGVPIDFSQQNLNRSSRYFSVIGWFIGAISAVVYMMVNMAFSENVSIIIAMLFGVLLTGCFHEDGLADTCDGFGGGWTKEQKLAIMKDSRLGTYGAAALWFALSMKYLLLTETSSVVVAFLVAHPLSRSLSTCMIYALDYAGDSQNSKSKPLASKQQFSDFAISLAVGCFALLLIPEKAWVVVTVLCLLFLAMRWLLLRQIDGFTGDTLGATQQVSEIAIYAVLATQVIGL